MEAERVILFSLLCLRLQGIHRYKHTAYKIILIRSPLSLALSSYIPLPGIQSFSFYSPQSISKFLIMMPIEILISPESNIIQPDIHPASTMTQQPGLNSFSLPVHTFLPLYIRLYTPGEGVSYHGP